MQICRLRPPFEGSHDGPCVSRYLNRETQASEMRIKHRNKESTEERGWDDREECADVCFYFHF